MSLTGKTIGELTKLSAITETTLFPVEFSGETFHIPYSSITTNIKPYKVYTALLTQTGSDNPYGENGGTAAGHYPELTIGITYYIADNYQLESDFTNIGAPNNNIGTYFVATGTTPASWGTYALLWWNIGAPVVTVLENTIGNIWFNYEDAGVYGCQSNDLFTSGKTFTINGPLNNANTSGWQVFYETASTNQLFFILVDKDGNSTDGIGDNFPIEIRVYN